MQREHARICACFFIIVMAFLPALFAVDCSQYGGCKMCDNQLRCLSTTSWVEIRSGFEWGQDLSCNDSSVTRRATCSSGGYVGGTIILRNFYNCYLDGTLVKSFDTGTTGGCATAAKATAAKDYCAGYFSFAWIVSPLSCTNGSAISDNVTVVGATESCPSGYFSVNGCPVISGSQTDEFGTKAMVCE
jgi:hypothetical protein